MPEFHDRRTGEVAEHNPNHISHPKGPTPTGVTFHIYEHDAKGAVPSHPTLSPSYEAYGHDKLAEVTKGQKDTLARTGKRYTVHSVVNVDQHEAEDHAQKNSSVAMRGDSRLDPTHPKYEHSGVGRMMIESQHLDSAREVAKKPIRSGFTVNH